MQQQFRELLGWGGEVEALAGAVVEFVGDGVELALGDGGEVEVLGEVLPQQAVTTLSERSRASALGSRVAVGGAGTSWHRNRSCMAQAMPLVDETALR